MLCEPGSAIRLIAGCCAWTCAYEVQAVCADRELPAVPSTVPMMGHLVTLHIADTYPADPVLRPLHGVMVRLICIAET